VKKFCEKMFKILLVAGFIGLGVNGDFASNLPAACDVPCTLDLRRELVCVFNGEAYEIYENQCDLKKANCTRGYVLQEVHIAKCLLRADEIPEFDECSWVCPSIISRVCGSNGTEYKIFENSCEMGRQSCIDDTKWMGAPMSICIAQEHDEKVKNCSKVCTDNYEPTCGFDGVEYSVFNNLCDFNISQCIDDGKWNHVPLITCNRKLHLNLDIPDSEKNENCPSTCSRLFFPVCGFDGKHYKIFNNGCTLRQAHCEKDRNWTKKSFFRCLFHRKN